MGRCRRAAIVLANKSLPQSFSSEISFLPLPSERVRNNWQTSRRRTRGIPADDALYRSQVADPKHYWSNRDTWPESPSKAADMPPNPLIRTGSVMLNFDPTFRRPRKEVTAGSHYPAKCSHVRASHERRAGASFSLIRGEEDIERATLPESRDHRNFEPTDPITERVPGLPLSVTRKPGFFATAPFSPPKHAPSEVLLIAELPRPKSRQQPDVPNPFYETAGPLISPGYPHRPLTPGGGLPHRP